MDIYIHQATGVRVESHRPKLKSNSITLEIATADIDDVGRKSPRREQITIFGLPQEVTATLMAALADAKTHRS